MKITRSLKLLVVVAMAIDKVDTLPSGSGSGDRPKRLRKSEKQENVMEDGQPTSDEVIDNQPTSEEVMDDEPKNRNDEAEIDMCNGCDYAADPICQECLHQESIIVVCGECFYTNECFATQAGQNAKTCKIVGTDP